MNPHAGEFLRIVNSPLKFTTFLLSRLPAAYLCGIRIKDISAERSTVSVRYSWLTQNPFKSIYFACLSMAAEMSTGVLALLHIYKRNPPVSMLLIKLESEFFKKSTGRILFSCKDGEALQLAVEEAVVTHEPVTCEARSIGINEKGEVVAEFKITWSFRVKNKAMGNGQ